jgi:DNA-binding response OmpR family regulator
MQNILVVEDDVDVADMLNAYFRVQGYEVQVAYEGGHAIETCRNGRPDLVILDIRLPDMDGYQVARSLRSNRRTAEIPIIFLTEKRQRADRLQGFEMGADDYITKPFDVQELRLRVRNALRRATQGTLTNPVTGLPEGALFDEKLSECLESDGWAMLQVSLENLDSFRETYGFVASDDVQRAVSLMILNAVRGVGSISDFIGQISPTVYILITVPASLPQLSERIKIRLEQSLDYFYPLKDRDQEAVTDNRLRVRMSQLLTSDGPFLGLDDLKAELLRRRN